MQQSLIMLNRDLMTGVAVSNAAKSMDLQPQRVGTTADLIAALRGEEGGRAALVVLDMNTDVDWEAMASFIAAAVEAPPIIGFGPHVDIEGRRAAKKAGLTRIYSNGEFHQRMGEILKRHTS